MAFTQYGATLGTNHVYIMFVLFCFLNGGERQALSIL